MKKYLIAAAIVLSVSAAAYGHNAMNRFWGEAPVDMLLSGDVLIVKTLTVPEGVKLTIDPGTVVRFEGSDGGTNRIVVRGELSAAGTKEKPITFMPKAKGSGPWYGIEFQGAGRGSLSHCVIQGASAG
ncbi:MAG: hypothetical protein ABSG42_05460, partial [Nitrospirota bacterium]